MQVRNQTYPIPFNRKPQNLTASDSSHELRIVPGGRSPPEGAEVGPVLDQYNVHWSLTLAKANDDAARHQVTLTVKLDQDPGSKKKTYYTGVFEIVGFFTVAKECPQDPGLFVQVSGASLLYSAVREMVCNLTANGPWPMISLPTVNFTPQPEAPKTAELTESATSEKKQNDG